MPVSRYTSPIFGCVRQVSVAPRRSSPSLVPERVMRDLADTTATEFGCLFVRLHHAIGVVPPGGGTYLVVATAADDGGREQTSSTIMWVSDSDAVGWATDPREKRMDLVADQDEYHPGDVARILVQSPFAGPVNAWLTIERGDVIDQRLVTLQTDSDVLEIPIRPAYAPGPRH